MCRRASEVKALFGGNVTGASARQDRLERIGERERDGRSGKKSKGRRNGKRR